MLTRTQTADVLKGIAILLMIQVHLVELFVTNEISESRVGNVLLFFGGPPVAPIFMTVFGYFVLATHKTTNELVYRGLKIFALGMVLNVALNFNLLIKVSRGVLQIDIWPYVFGVDVLQFAGLSLILVALFKSFIQKYVFIVLATIPIIVFLGEYVFTYVPENIFLKYISAFLYGSTSWSYFPLFPWLAYPLCGIVLFQIQQRFDFKFFYMPKTKLLFGCIFLLFMIFTIKYAIVVSSNLPLYYHHDLLFFIWVILFCLFYALLIHELNNWMGETLVFKYFKWLGKHVTLIYVIQWLLIGNIATEIYKTVSNPIYIAGWFLGITVSSSCLTYLVLKFNNLLVTRLKTT
jgi:uncharacterized membrane protein